MGSGEGLEMATGHRVYRRVKRSTLVRLRALASADAIPLLADCAKQDPSYRPLKDVSSRRWHLRTAIGEFEILTTATKWYDMRARLGGGGAIDLTMHLLGLSFMQAVDYLERRARPDG